MASLNDLDPDTRPDLKGDGKFDTAAHLDGFRMPDFDAGEEDADGPREVGEDGEIIGEDPEIMDAETFWMTFQLVFSLPGTFLPEFAPLAIQPQEVQPARASSDGCYELLRIWYPAALRPGNETLGLLLKAAPFIIAKVMVVRTILANRARRAERPQDGGEGAFRSQRAAEGGQAPAQPPREGSGPLLPDFGGVPE